MKRYRGVARRIWLTVVVYIICASAATSADNKETEEVFLSQLAIPETGQVDESLAELLRITCNLDLVHLKKFHNSIDLCLSEQGSGSNTEIHSECRFAEKERIRRIFSILHPQLKQIVLDCIRKNNGLIPVSGEEIDSTSWYPKYLESLFLKFSTPRRNLQSRLLQSSAEGPAVEPPILSPAPSPSRPQSPVLSPPAPFFPPNSIHSSLQPSSQESSSASTSFTPNVPEDKKSNTNRAVIIAVAVTASVTFLVAAIFFLCCTKLCQRHSKDRQTDERPLLSLSLSDFSGSTPKSSASGDSIKEGKLGHQSFGDNSNNDKKSSSSNKHEFASLGAATGANKSTVESLNLSSNTNGELPPPPGRAPIPSGLPPLKPPPGRADPLPPEPPSSFKAASGRAGPHIPPPPVPPPSVRPPGNAARPPGPPPPLPPGPPGGKTGPRPPPPPKSVLTPPRPPPPVAGSKAARPSKNPSDSASSEGAMDDDSDTPKAKLKPFFWDKVLATPDQSMVWHQIKSGSFQFNEEMIETLFGYTPVDKHKRDQKKESSWQDPNQYIRIIDVKKAQNLSILLRALNVTKEEVCDAINEGNELPSELIQNLLKMAPTQEEELKLRLFNGELSQLGPAERFLKALVDIPFAFKRLEALLFICTLQDDVTTTKDSFVTLEIACKELRNSRLFLKLLEAVLKTGNRMNDGTFRGGAQAFKLDTLLKLSDVRGTDGKTTLLHFVVQEIIRSEGVKAARAARTTTQSSIFSSVQSDDLIEETSQDTEEHYRSLGLQVVSGLGSGLENVKKAAALDADSLTGTLSKLGRALVKTQNFLDSDLKSLGEDSAFYQMLKSFVQNAEVDIRWLHEEDKRIVGLVKKTGDYFHGNAGKDEGLRLFVIVRDFLIMLDKVCKEVKNAPRKLPAATKKATTSSDINQTLTVPNSSDPGQSLSPDLRQQLFPAIMDRRMDNSSSDDES